jgi:hypothetical protein
VSARGGKIARVINRALCACGAVLLAAQASPAAAASAGGWSSPVTLGSCAAAIGPRVAFPSEGPSTRTGPGTVVWAQDPRCAAGSSALARSLSETALGRDDRPTGSSVSPLLDSAAAGLEAVGASKGMVAVAATGAGASPVVVGQGRAPESSPVASLPAGGGPFSLAHAYLGDSAIAIVEPGGSISVRVERYFRSAFAPAKRIAIAPAPVSELVATMDYRSDVLLAWQQNGAIYAHMLRASGRAEPTQLVGPSAPHPQLRALVSDNDHGMIAWSSAGGAPPGARTRIRIAFSGAGVRFAGSRRVASFPDASGIGRAPGSLALERLSTENVMLAWTDAEAGSFVVRAAPAVFAGTSPATRLSDPSTDSVLAALAAGPAGEAVALWRSSPSGSSPNAPRGQLWAARTAIERHGRVGSRAPEVVAPAAAGTAAATLAVDPASDRAVAAWLTSTARPRVEYAVGPDGSAYRPRPVLANASRGTGGSRSHGVAIGLAAAAIGLVMVFALRRLARPRNAGGGAIGRSRRRR